jgi:hypothetical protein
MLRHNFLVNYNSAFSFFSKCTLEEKRKIASYKRLPGNNDAIHLLCSGCDEHTISFLINHGSSVNAVNNNYQSPLHIAIKSQNVRAVRGLIACGANVNLCCGVYHPIDVAIKHIMVFGRKKVKPQADAISILRMLVEAGSRISSVRPKVFEILKSKEAIDLVLDSCSVNDAERFLRTAFDNLNVSLIESLAERGEFLGDVFYPQIFMHNCITDNNPKTLEKFLKLGYTPTYKPSENDYETIDPLCHAVRGGQRKIVDLLLAYGAEPTYPRVFYIQKLSIYVLISVLAVALDRNIEVKWLGNTTDYCTNYYSFRLMLLSNIGIGARDAVRKRLGSRMYLSRQQEKCLQLVNDDRFPTLTDVIMHQQLLRERITKIKRLRR